MATHETKKVVVTGTTGYIGRHLTEALLAKGFEVHALVRETHRVSPKQNLYVYEYNGDAEALLILFKKIQPETIFHLAAKILAENDPHQVRELIESNVLFGTQLAEAAVHTGVRFFIQSGTYWQHYHCEGYSPVNLYAATKQAFDDILVYYRERYGLITLTLCLYDVYGPRDDRHKILAQLKEAMENKTALDLTAGTQLLDLVHIDDVVKAYLCAYDALKTTPDLNGKTFAVRSGQPVSLQELVRRLENISGKKIDAHWGAKAYRQRQILKLWEGPILPSWEAQITLEQGLAQALHEGVSS